MEQNGAENTEIHENQIPSAKASYYSSEALKPAINKLIAHFSLSVSAVRKSSSGLNLSGAVGIGNIS